MLIVGCGDVGLRVLRRLQGWRVLALTSSVDKLATLRAAGAVPLLGNLDDAGSLGRLGGLADAVQIARNLAGLAADRELALVPFPAERNIFEIWAEELFGADAAATRRSFASVLRAVHALAPLIESVAPMIDAGDKRLLAPPMQVQ